MSIVSCPVCGSSSVWKHEQTETLFTTSPEGDEHEEEYHYIRFECDACESEWSSQEDF